MKTGVEILAFMEDSGLSLNSMSSDVFCYEHIPARLKDRTIRFVFDSLDEATLIEAIPGYGNFPHLGYEFKTDPTEYMDRLRSLLRTEDAADVLESEATIAAGLTVDELLQLLETDKWECYGKIATAVNSYIEPKIAERVNECVSLYVSEKMKAIAC